MLTGKKSGFLPNRFPTRLKKCLLNSFIGYTLLNTTYPDLKKDIDVSCSFCKKKPETAVHLFWHCPYVSLFWQNVLYFIVGNIDENFTLLWKDVLLGIVNSKDKTPCTYFIIFFYFDG